MKCYSYPSLFFKKNWCWFTNPVDESSFDLVNYFSYNKVDVEGFRRKEGLTSVIDLTQAPEDIWSRFRKSFVRKQIKRGERNGILVKKSNNFKEFKKIYFGFRKEKNIGSDKYKAFIDNGILFSAYYKDKMIAGGVFITDDKNIRAWVLASLRLDGVSGNMREIIGQANRMLIWEVIKYAQEKKLQVFDLGGINPESEKPGEKSLAEFKEAFGGVRKKCYYYSKVYSKLLRFIMKLRGFKV